MTAGISTGGVRRGGNIGEQVATRVALRPVASIAAALEGVTIDRAMGGGPWLLSGMFTVFTGLTPSAPTTSAIAWKVQHSANGTDWVDATVGKFGAVSGTIATPATSNQETGIMDLSHLNRYVRIHITITFTGGSTPTLLTAALFVTGEYDGQTPITQEAEV